MSLQVLTLLYWAPYFCSLAIATPKAISIPPDTSFHGIDGKWSTFQISIGTPGQVLSLLPGTSALPMSATWVIDQQGCTTAKSVLSYPIPPSCDASRGGLFYTNESTTYSTEHLTNNGQGTLYTLAATVEGFDGYLSNGQLAYFGFDTISLGVPGTKSPVVKHQVISSLVIPNFWLGFIGLSPWATNFSSFADPQASLLSTLAENDISPSRSWSYTAGAWYKSPPAFGSLTIGGYDRSRFSSNNKTFAFSAEFNRDLLVSLNSIMSNIIGQAPLLAQSTDIFIDSLVSELWLPTSVCMQFEEQFQLKYDNNSGRYLLDETTHAALLAANPSFTFNIGQPAATRSEKDSTLDIVLPYAAFDLNVTNPIVNGSARYFPIRRATSERQYILGRVFLQEAFLIADYERRTFSVSQAAFPSTAMPQEIVDINPPTSESSNSKIKSHHHNAITPGVIAGITVGVAVSLALKSTALVYYGKRRQRKKQAAVQDPESPTYVNEKDGVVLGELDQPEKVVAELNEDAALYELQVSKEHSELPTTNFVAELEAD